jgi:hypothetical protein
MKLIAAGLGNDIHIRPRVPAVTGVIGGGLDFELGAALLDCAILWV